MAVSRAGLAALLMVAAAAPSQARWGVARMLEESVRAPEAERLLLISAIGARGKSKAVPELLSRLEAQAADPKMEAALLEALGRIGDRRALPALRGCAEKRSGETAADCLRALGRLGDREAVAVVGARAADADSSVARAAIEAAGQLGGPAMEAVLLQAKNSTAVELRDAAAFSLARLGRRGERVALGDSLSSGGEPDLWAAAYLLRLGSDRGLDVLARALNGPRGELAAELLADAGDPRAAIPLSELLARPEPALRLSAARALGRLGGVRARFELARASRASDPALREEARRSRARLGDYEAP